MDGSEGDNLYDSIVIGCGMAGLAAGIRLADRVNTVSPTYAREILEKNDPERGYYGGEGLEADLTNAQASGRLAGILNGCNYPKPVSRRPGWGRMLKTWGGCSWV